MSKEQQNIYERERPITNPPTKRNVIDENNEGVECERMRDGHKLIRAIAYSIIENADNSNFVRNKAHNIVRWIELNVDFEETENG